MEPLQIRAKEGPEAKIQKLYIPYLEGRGWLVERFIGNAFQYGIPDLYLFKREWGARWVDIKVHGNYKFTRAQRIKWPIWEKAGLGIWILGATCPEECTKEHMANEHKLLFEGPNWREFWKPSWEIGINELIDKEFPNGVDPST